MVLSQQHVLPAVISWHRRAPSQHYAHHSLHCRLQTGRCHSPYRLHRAWTSHSNNSSSSILKNSSTFRARPRPQSRTYIVRPLAAFGEMTSVQLITSDFLTADDVPPGTHLHLIVLNYVLPQQTARLWQRGVLSNTAESCCDVRVCFILRCLSMFATCLLVNTHAAHMLLPTVLHAFQEASPDPVCPLFALLQLVLIPRLTDSQAGNCTQLHNHSSMFFQAVQPPAVAQHNM